MSESGLQKAIVALLAAACVGVTILVAMAVLARYSQDAQNLSTGPIVTSPDGVTGSQQPPILMPLPDFTLTDQHGESFGLSNLRGKVWIANFVFTTCRGPCQMMTSQMATLQQTLQGQHPKWDQIALISITVDPSNDTPEVLKEYARLALADPEHWRFLTGERATIWRLVRDGFKLPVGEDADNEQMPIFHSQRFVLVDEVGQIRGFYEGLEEAGRAKLLADLDGLLSQ